jgi:predicted ribosome quality control (RQC) complex YloA/Tae2 family protein
MAAERDLARHVQWREFRRDADLLAAGLHLVAPGSRHADVTEYLADGSEQQVRLELDPSKSPSRNLTELYRRAAKGERGEQMAIRRIADLNTRLDEAEADLAAAAMAMAAANGNEETGIVSQAQARPKTREVPKQTPPQSMSIRGIDGLDRHLKPKVYHTEAGTLVLVGRNSAGNDVLTMRLANGNDWFFHVAGTPGSHVILKWAKRGEMPPRDDMESAAMLALHFSRLKDASRAVVTYCQRKHVSKPKGAAPGLVYVRNGKSMTVRIDKARLARLLGKELE